METLGKLYIIAGFKGSGKSSIVRKIIEKNNHLVFDVNNEYKNLPFDNKMAKSRFIGNYEDFVSIARSKKNTYVVYEDASGFFDGRVGKETRRAMTEVRHANNVIIYLFHSVHLIPKGIIAFSDIIILFKTNDIEKDVLRKYPKLIESYKKVNSTDWPKFKPIIIKLQ